MKFSITIKTREETGVMLAEKDVTSAIKPRNIATDISWCLHPAPPLEAYAKLCIHTSNSIYFVETQFRCEIITKSVGEIGTVWKKDKRN